MFKKQKYKFVTGVGNVGNGITQEVVGFAADVLLLTFKTQKEVPLD